MSIRKNIWMAVLTVITVCCVIGGTFYHAGIFGLQDRFHFRDDKTINVSTDLEAFCAIDVDADMMDLSIEKGDRFYIDGKYTDVLQFEYEVKDKTLYIKGKTVRKAFLRGNGNYKCNITLTVPENTTMDSMEIKLAMGNINVENITSIDCKALTNMGNCIFEKCSFGEADIDTNMGEITIKDTDLGESEIDNNMGSIKMERCIFQDLDVDNSMGEISIDINQNIDEYQIDLKAEMGDVRVNGQSEGTKYRQSGNNGKLTASTSMGSVTLDYYTGGRKD